MSCKKSCCGSDRVATGADLREQVKAVYGAAAQHAAGQERACCCEGPDVSVITRDLYSEAETAGLPAEALLASLGCGNPTALAALQPGEVVLDLGSGGGIDVLISAKRVGPTGKAYGLDMTDEMLALAHQNQAASGIENAEFLRGEIESIPLPDASVDVIISNCVINLSADKDQVFREAFRVLRPGGRFAVADIVLTQPLPAEALAHVALWTGCVAGALVREDYRARLEAAGFEGVELETVRTYRAEDAEGLLPAELLAQFSPEDLAALAGSFRSAFIRATKPV
jgi:arsenite methyltransferase